MVEMTLNNSVLPPIKNSDNIRIKFNSRPLQTAASALNRNSEHTSRAGSYRKDRVVNVGKHNLGDKFDIYPA